MSAGALNQPQYAVAIFDIYHRGEKPARCIVCIRTELAKCAADSLRLQDCQPESEAFAFRRRIQQALTAVLRPFLLQNVTLVDQLLEHAAERLLGDVEDLQQVGNLYARVAVYELQHPMMGAANIKLEENLLRIANKIAISEKQKFDDVPDRFGRCWSAARAFGYTGSCAGFASRNYVSHVDIFCFYVTKTRR